MEITYNGKMAQQKAFAYHIARMFGSGNVGEFGESLVIHQILPSNLMICAMNKANKQKFTEVLLAKHSHYMICDYLSKNQPGSHLRFCQIIGL